MSSEAVPPHEAGTNALVSAGHFLKQFVVEVNSIFGLFQSFAAIFS